jgi:nucleoside phosphorylase
MSKTLCITAMDRENAGLIARIGATRDADLPGRFPCWIARHGDREIGVVQTHVGEANAAIATTAALARFAPDRVIKLGCVGGHAEDVHTGDVVLPVGFFHSGAWITRDSVGVVTADATRWQSVFGGLPYQVNRENLGGRPAVIAPNPGLTDSLASALAAAGIAAARAYIGGSAMWFFDLAFMRHVLTAQVPDATTSRWAADMESHAVAQACAARDTPFSGVYRVSNSDFYGEPYRPDAIAALFDGAFIDAVVRSIPT